MLTEPTKAEEPECNPDFEVCTKTEIFEEVVFVEGV